MSALVHLPNNSRISLYLKPNPAEGFEAISTVSKFGVEFRAAAEHAPEAELLSGKEAGGSVSKIAANQRAVLHLGYIKPYKYQSIVTINPEFNLFATVVGPGILEPREEVPLSLVINAHKEVDLSKISWFCRVYMFE